MVGAQEQQGGRVTAARTLPDHETCGTHKLYLLTCEQYEGLIAESGGGCQLCDFPAAGMPQRKLYIDHDYRGFWAVRGLLCIRCNSAIGDKRVGKKPAGMAAYLANAWFQRMYNERGISPNPAFRPPEGTAVLDGTGAHWAYGSGGRWTSDRGDRARNWRELFRRFGPYNLTVVPRD